MRKPVKNLVNKRWARRVSELLTTCPPTTCDLFTNLLTITTNETQEMKSLAAKDRCMQGYAAICEAVKYGWAFGLNEQQATIKKPAIFKGCRRIRALLPPAIACGEAIGRQQARKIEKAHGIPTPGTFTHRHQHAAPPS